MQENVIVLIVESRDGPAATITAVLDFISFEILNVKFFVDL